MRETLHRFMLRYKGTLLDVAVSECFFYPNISGNVADKIKRVVDSHRKLIGEKRDILLVGMLDLPIGDLIEKKAKAGINYTDTEKFLIAEYARASLYVEEEFKKYLKRFYYIESQKVFDVIYAKAIQEKPKTYWKIEINFRGLVDFITDLKKVGGF